MNDLLVERFFSVSVELTDGRSTQLKVRGESPAEVFKDVRARADVRRVGKVVEIDEGSFHSERPISSASSVPSTSTSSATSSGNGSSSRSASKPSGGNDRVATDRPAKDHGTNDRAGTDRHQGEDHQSPSDPKTPREALIGFTISGPRVIRSVKPVAYERPTNHFRAPIPKFNPLPPQSKPAFSPFGPVKGPVANDPSRPSVFAKPAPAAEAPQAQVPAPSSEAPATAGDSATVVERDYRIVKSRRQSGEPYLLQRGTWGQVKGKRAFIVEWEKGFDSREKAEKQQTWLEQMARESAELNNDEE
ncbi:hypothetical protein [Humisphaera borealis]|uniref:Uncharacterized protein n=1 Tax=Humisphaera borealis TaxID=2807512 RepID=A0A7M2X2J8_9BACT|nr:hypothetical protein [Humisphaera borealis]QOV91271.1 hypothetical protein IPV69_07910 [Humisphaera borealis]